MPTPYYIAFLKKQLEDRKRKNSRYSLRAFAQHLQMDPSALSRILLGKQRISLQTAEKISQTLRSNVEEKRLFLSSVALERKTQAESRLAQGLEENNLSPKMRTLDAKVFERVDAFLDLAVLEALRLEDCQPQSKWLANRLGMTAGQVEASLSRLQALELVKSLDGKLVKADNHLATSAPDANAAKHRQYQLQILERAGQSLEARGTEPQTFLSLLMAIDPQKLPVARAMLQSCLSDLSDTLESGSRQRVYQLAVQLFPVDIVPEAEAPNH